MTEIMEQWRQVYLEKSRDFLCEPVGVLVAAIDAAKAKDEVLTAIQLNGNSKELFKNRVSYMRIFALSEALHEFPYLEYLDLSYNNMDDAGVATVARLLKFSKSLKRLDLEGNAITADGAAKVAHELVEGEALEVLNLNYNPIGEGGGEAMAAMLQVNQCLKALDIGNTDLGMRSLVAIAEALNAHNRTLQYLNVENPTLQTIQEESTLHFTRMLAANDVLQCLHFGKHRMRDFGMETMVAYGLVTNCTLTTLDLRCNTLTEESGATLARVLTDNTTIHTLNISSNRLKDNGTVALAAALPTNQSLTYLDLSSNQIEEKGLIALAEGIRFNASVQTLRVWGNVFAPLSSEAWYALVQEKLGLLGAFDVDVEPYRIDNAIHVAKVDHHGPKKIPWQQFMLTQAVEG